jgi:hypothetical protein
MNSLYLRSEDANYVFYVPVPLWYLRSSHMFLGINVKMLSSFNVVCLRISLFLLSPSHCSKVKVTLRPTLSFRASIFFFR